MWVASTLLFFAGLFAQTPPQSNVADIVRTYCSGCHNGTMRSPSGVLLDQFDAAHIAEQPDVWARAYRQLQAGTMPPVGAARPDRATYDAVLSSIEKAWSANSKPPAGATNHEIATQLAALLWNGPPDSSLIEDAHLNRLSDSAVLERQIHRMLADGRSAAFVSRFFFPWLGLDKLSTAEPNKQFFPDYDASLKDAFLKETELFILSQLREDKDPVELWSANYTFLNDQLARHYDIPNINGSQFRRVTLPSHERDGLLGQGSVLMVTSRHQPNSSSAFTTPAGRSIWVRLHFLGAPQPNPFPGAQPVKPDLPITPQTRTLPSEPCVHCHQNFFPLGYALENFDPIGKWRTQDQIGPVDASGTFVDGTSTNGVIELRNVLLQRPEAFRTTITENLLLYASGKPLNPTSRSPETLIRARQIFRSRQNARWSTIIAGIVQGR
jgi:uncharacterized protein DUF1592/uncharacterized protein DUF1588/uncharacterized protein DUF1585